MLFRFSELPILDNGDYDYDCSVFLGSSTHKDYIEYYNLLNAMKNNDTELVLVKDRLDARGEIVSDIDELRYTIIDIRVRASLDNINIDCVEVYVSEVM